MKEVDSTKGRNKKPIILFIGIVIAIVAGIFIFRSDRESLRIVFVTDWEYGEMKRIGSKASGSADEELKKVVKSAHRGINPDLAIGGGDYINGAKIDEKKATEQLKLERDIFEKIKSEKVYLLGDHDLKKIPLQQAEEILGVKYQNNRIDKKGYRVVFLNSQEIFRGEGERLEKELAWLKAQLKDGLPVIIFSHFNIIATPQKDKWKRAAGNSDKIREVLQNHPNVVAVIMGEGLRDYAVREKGIVYVSIPGLVEQDYVGSYAEIQATKKDNLAEIKVIRRGIDPIEYIIFKDLTDIYSAKIEAKGEEKIAEILWNELGVQKEGNVMASESQGTESSLSVSENGKVFVAYEDGEDKNKARIRSVGAKEAQNLEGQNSQQGKISQQKGGDPFVEASSEKTYVGFMDYQNGARARIREWDGVEWRDLADANHPEGLISISKGHEPVLALDQSKQLYVAFNQGANSEVECGDELCWVKVMKWSGDVWEDLGDQSFVQQSVNNQPGTEVAIAASKIDESVYIAFQNQSQNNKIQVKQYDGERWKNISNLDNNLATNISGFSPSITTGKNGGLYLAYVGENFEKLYIQEWDGNEWHPVGDGAISSGKCSEVDIAVSDSGIIYAAYSQYKKNTIIPKKSKKKNSEEYFPSRSNAWRVRVKRLNGEKWESISDDLNPSGYISRGNGKGDPSLDVWKENIYVSFTDKASDYKVKVKQTQIK